MTSLVFLATYLFKIPTINGYVHIGDGLIFFSVYFLGIKKGAIASAIGSSIADLAASYFVYALPTFIIKALMATIMGFISLVLLKRHKHRFIIGCILSGAIQVILYAFINMYFYGNSGIFITILSDTAQTFVGIFLFLGIVYFMEAYGVKKTDKGDK